MFIRLGENELFLDKSGACVLPSIGLLVINGIAWGEQNRELFPEFGQITQSQENIARLASEFRTSQVLFLGKSVPFEPETLEAFAKSLGMASLWVGADPHLVPEDSNVCDEITFDQVAFGTRKFMTPAIVGGFSPGDSGGSCFLLYENNLILPSQSDLVKSVPDFIAPKCDAYWLGRNSVIRGQFESINHSLR